MRNGGNILDLKAALGHVKIEQTMVYARSPFVGNQFQPDQRPQSIAIKMATKWRRYSTNLAIIHQNTLY